MEHQYLVPRPVTRSEQFDFSNSEWKYDMRHQCQEVLPHLYLGPTDSSKSLEALQALGITGIVILRNSSEGRFLKARFPANFEYLALEVEDRDDQNLIRSVYPQARQFLLSHQQRSGKVLVHDDGGISRAPAIAVMHVMDMQGYSYEDAMVYVQSKRYCMHINPGFMNQCKEFEALCAANRSTTQEPPSNGMDLNPDVVPNRSSRKREMSADGPDEERPGFGPAYGAFR